MMGWCKVSDSVQAKMDEEQERKAWGTAALRFIGHRLSTANVIWPTQHDIEFSERKLSELRIWVSSIADEKMQQACAEWVKYGERQLTEARMALKQQERVNSILSSQR